MIWKGYSFRMATNVVNVHILWCFNCGETHMKYERKNNDS